MNCLCDGVVIPPPLDIPSGLSSLPRQTAGFPEFRTALLSAIRTRVALRDWRARDPQDFGVMLLEMWAYVCDVVSFYDQVLANEAYLRTARRRASLRRLTGLLGYLPRPASAATVRLAVSVDGHSPVPLPAGMAFRSGAFDGEPPQVFELDANTEAHPSFNQTTILPPRPTSLSGSLSSFHVEPASLRVKAGQPLLCSFRGTGVEAETHVRVVRAVERIIGPDGNRYARILLDRPIDLAAEHPVADVTLETPTARTPLWTHEKGTTPLQLGGANVLFVLDGARREFHVGQTLIAGLRGEFRVFSVTERYELWVVTVSSQSFMVGDKTVTLPEVTLPATWIYAEPGVNANKAPGAPDWAEVDGDELLLHHELISAGTVTLPAATMLSVTDPLTVAELRIGPGGPPTPAPGRFLLRDAEERGLDVEGGVNPTTRELTLASGTSWSPPLALPVTVYGNVVSASRGERVPGEILGSGNASVANQSFALKKSPLTYVPSESAGNEAGVASTLAVWVDGIRWDEVPSFFQAGPTSQVYVVREDDEGRSRAIFGDGLRGARLPTGVDNVVASYRFGAGAATPPAGSITQLVRPVRGLARVVNPVAATGGADAEKPEQLRARAPRSALLLGRAVSIQDMEAAVLATAGVRAAQAEWRWDGKRQRAVAKVFYIGGSGLESTLTARLRALTDPSTSIDVELAVAVPVVLSIDLEHDPRRDGATVNEAVRSALMEPEHGLLAPERVGIGAPLFRSRLFETCLSVPGALGVRAVFWNGQPFSAYGKKPGAGHYFDFDGGDVVITGSVG